MKNPLIGFSQGLSRSHFYRMLWGIGLLIVLSLFYMQYVAQYHPANGRYFGLALIIQATTSLVLYTLLRFGLASANLLSGPNPGVGVVMLSVLGLVGAVAVALASMTLHVWQSPHLLEQGQSWFTQWLNRGQPVDLTTFVFTGWMALVVLAVGVLGFFDEVVGTLNRVAGTLKRFAPVGLTKGLTRRNKGPKSSQHSPYTPDTGGFGSPQAFDQ